MTTPQTLRDLREPLEAIRSRDRAWATAQWGDQSDPLNRPHEHPDTECSADRDRHFLLDRLEAAERAVNNLRWWILQDVIHERNESIRDIAPCNHNESPPECMGDAQALAAAYNARAALSQPHSAEPEGVAE